MHYQILMQMYANKSVDIADSGSFYFSKMMFSSETDFKAI